MLFNYCKLSRLPKRDTAPTSCSFAPASLHHWAAAIREKWPLAEQGPSITALQRGTRPNTEALQQPADFEKNGRPIRHTFCRTSSLVVLDFLGRGADSVQREAMILMNPQHLSLQPPEPAYNTLFMPFLYINLLFPLAIFQITPFVYS
ncbi:hypothetical protein MHYP_G00359230 [Metynnis hypsauchen]